MIRFEYAYLLWALVPLLIIIGWYRLMRYKPISYSYALAHWLARMVRGATYARPLITAVRYANICLLALLITKPQLVDQTFTVHGKGVDIMVVLDVSGSMSFVDDPQNPEPRIEIAKKEALRFIEKRPYDQIGLVIFGREALSRIPLTLDKNLLRSSIKDLEIGVVPHNGTVLAKSMAVAASRLKHSTAASKVMILLTDGAPEGDPLDPQTAVALVKQLGIKVYTIGIGGDKAYGLHPIFNQYVPVGSNLNRELLQYIADQTGGHYFEAAHSTQLRTIYDHIDRLEKSDYDSTVLSTYRDFFIPLVWLSIGLLSAELVLSSMVWLVL